MLNHCWVQVIQSGSHGQIFVPNPDSFLPRRIELSEHLRFGIEIEVGVCFIGLCKLSYTSKQLK